MTQHSSHSEWVLNLIVQIDCDHPGFCGAFFRASAERRQVIATYLSARPSSAESSAHIASFLLRAGHDDILSRAFVERPVGLRGALRRAGPLVHEECFYGTLYRLLTEPPHKEVGTVIQSMNRIDLTRLRIVSVLPAEVCRANVVLALSSMSAAADLVLAMRTLTDAGADGEALATAIRKVRDEKMLRKVVGRALLKCRAPAHPVPKSESYRPILSGGDLHQLATRYRNCVRGYTLSFLDEEGGQAFAEVNRDGEGAVVHLIRNGNRWKMEGIFGPHNRRPSESLRRHVMTYLDEHNVFVPQGNRSTSGWDAVRRSSSTPLFELDLG